MQLTIPKDLFSGNPTMPRLFLCTQSGKRMGELQGYDVKLNAKWNSYSELSFSIDRKYTDIITGESKVNPLFDKAETLRQVLVENIGYFIIQDQDDSFSDKDSKTITAFSAEYATSQKYLENFYINTGEEDSVEVIYETKKYGENRTVDSLYDPASGPYDEHRRYFIREYNAQTSGYTYIRIQIEDEDDYNSHFGDGINKDDPLYVSNYENVQFYDEQNPELSLLHLVFKKIPGWKIKHVDTKLKQKERKFSEERISVYDFLTNNVCETFKCVVEWDTLTKEVSFYEEEDDGIHDDGTIQSRYRTDVFISKENLASQVNVKVSSDNIKTKLKVSGSDGLDIREVNLGKNYIMNLDYYHNSDWMEQDLKEAYQDYIDAVNKYSKPYEDAVQGWVKAYNSWDALMNAVPVDGNVLRVGDEFKKLYCTYSPIDTAYLKDQTIADGDINTLVVDALYSDEECTKTIDKSLLSDGDLFVIQGYGFVYQSKTNNFKCTRHITEDTAIDELKKKLGLYLVNEDTEANKGDNILLRLKNDSSDVATIRIYNSGTKDAPEYLIQCIIISASTGLSGDPFTRTLKQWINGTLTAEQMSLEGYKVQSIGTMGAYFVLAKDEKIKANLQDYGIRLLQEKQTTYTTIFQTQIEAMFSDDKYQCTASDEEPTGSIAEGTRWIDTNSSPVKLYEYRSGEWVEFTTDLSNYQNYQRYLDNFEKLKAVQEVLVAKEKEAEYWLNGYKVSSVRIDKDNLTENELTEKMKLAALTHFELEADAITGGILKDEVLLLYSFTTSAYPDKQFAVYLKGTTPYIAYLESCGVYQSKRDSLSELTDFEAFFDEDQWMRLSPLIREDEYTDDNFLLTGYESEMERLEVYKELREYAAKELKTLSQPSFEFSMDMANILALPEFEPIKNQFALGKFIRIGLRPGEVKKSRLLEVQLSFDNLSDFSCTFGNLVTTYDQVNLHAELLKQAVTAGKTVAAKQGEWQKAVDKSNKIEESINNGLKDCAIRITSASGQVSSCDNTGMHFRKYKDGSNTEFELEEIAITNNSIVATNNGWLTSKAAFGKYSINGKERWGPIAEYVTADTIEGKLIKGGKIIIGEDGGSQFIVSEDGSVQITDASGHDKYASQSTVETLKNARRYRVELSYDKSTLFSDVGSECTITCTVYSWSDDVTQTLIDNKVTFAWKRISNSDDAIWNNNHQWSATHDGLQPNQIKITNDDIPKNAQIECQIQFDDSILKKEGE